MDASAYLKKQGWKGDGHSLDHTNRGIKKPLLVGQKVDVLGLGLDKHSTVSDQWWLRAFDQGLKSLGTGEETTLSSVQKHGIKRGGLYGRFVKGEKLAGSIEQTPQSSENEKSDRKMAIDIPPEDKLERVVGHHEDKNHHDAMMHLLQNPDDAPSSMRKLLDRKRKRAERPVEKRARRKTEKIQKTKQQSRDRRERAIDEGTWDAEKEEEHRKMREINRRADEFVLEAQKRGIIPLGPNEIRRGIVPASGANADALPNQPRDDMQQVFNQIGLNTQVKFKGSGKNSLKAQKYAREKMKRELKRAAKAYLMGEKPPHEMTKEERKAKHAKKKLGTAQRKADAAKKEAERMAGREERAAQKREHRMKRAAEKAEIEKIMKERDEALNAGKTLDEYYAERAEREAAVANGEIVDSESTDDKSGSASDESGEKSRSTSMTSNEAENDAIASGNSNVTEFENGADEVKFGMNRKGGKKKIPGVGAVERYPTKGEKKAKKIKAMSVRAGISEEEMKARLQAESMKKQDVEREKIESYRAMKHGMSLEQYRNALATGEVQPPAIEKKNIPPAKLAEYRSRAAEKGVTLEEYIKRREEKAAAKVGEKLGNPFQRDIYSTAKDDAEYVAIEPENHNGSDGVGFVIDTAGDDKLGNFQDKTRALISQGKPLAIVDTNGDDTYTYAPNMPVPLDPRIWEGKNVKDLPRPVRKARRDWMAARREEKKARARLQPTDQNLPPKKKKGQRKIEAREAFVKQVLWHSRNALRYGGDDSGMVTIDGVENVPLVKVESTQGIFRKTEVGLARTVARRVLRTVKREEKAKQGKGKGYKKRERAAKEAARNAGISGFTDKARFDPGGNRDLLL